MQVCPVASTFVQGLAQSVLTVKSRVRSLLASGFHRIKKASLRDAFINKISNSLEHESKTKVAGVKFTGTPYDHIVRIGVA